MAEGFSIQVERPVITSSLFCYGTLEYPEIMKKVTGELFPYEAATLDGYARYLVRGKVYPAVVAQAGGRVQGTVFHRLADQHIRYLDRYEGTVYDREQVTVVNRLGEPIRAMVYLYRETQKHLLHEQDWDRTVFENQHMQQYLEAI